MAAAARTTRGVPSSGCCSSTSPRAASLSTTTTVAAEGKATVVEPYDWKRIKAFLFDIDGTLADTDPLHFVAFKVSPASRHPPPNPPHSLTPRNASQDCLKKVGYMSAGQIIHDFDEETFQKRVAGRANPAIAADLLSHLSDEDKVAWCVDKEAYFRDLAKAGMPPVDGLIELLDWIDASGLKCAAVTNAPRDNAEQLLQGLGIMERLDEIIIAQECEHMKPHPDPYLTAMRKLGLDAGSCCAVEDSFAGATAAVTAGAYTVGILTSQTHEYLAGAGCKTTCTNYHELLSEIMKSRGEGA